MRENRTHGSMRRREETRPVGLTQPRGPGASRRPYREACSSPAKVLSTGMSWRGTSPLPPRKALSTWRSGPQPAAQRARRHQEQLANDTDLHRR